MRHADHCAFQNPGQVINQALDLLGVDIKATGDDQILLSPDNGDIAVGVDPCHVTRDEPAVRLQFLGCLFWHLPIALKHIRAAHFQHADFAGWHLGPVFHHPRLHARQRKAHGACATLSLVGVRRAHIGFGHPVAFENTVTCPHLPLFVGIDQQGGRAGDEQAHIGGTLARQPRIGQKAGVKGRHPHQRRRARHGVQNRLTIKPRQEHHRRPGQKRHIGRHEQPVGVKDRQGMDQHII